MKIQNYMYQIVYINIYKIWDIKWDIKYYHIHILIYLLNKHVLVLNICIKYINLYKNKIILLKYLWIVKNIYIKIYNKNKKINR